MPKDVTGALILIGVIVAAIIVANLVQKHLPA